MRLIQRMGVVLDFEIARKTFLWLSVLPILVIPIDGILISWDRSKPVKPQAVTSEKIISNHSSQETYLSAFEKSALFGTALGTSLPGLQSSLAELAKDYRLKGVVLADEPEAIVEDVKTRKSVFLNIGGKLGDLTVKEIKEGLVVLSYLGEEIKLEIK